jgi:membrane fusion protein, multidrug efflux system
MPFASKPAKIVAAVIAAALLGGLAVTQSGGVSFGDKAGKSSAKAAPAVTITTPVAKDLPIELTAQGHLVALNQVDVRPQIAGVIRTVEFHEGDAVKAGQLLFTLDATEPVSQLNRMRGNSANVKAQLDDAVRAYDRSLELLKAKFLSQSAVDSALSKVDSLRAQLKTADADIDNARAQVDHTRIVSPLTGKAGALNVHVGSLAQPTAALPLVSLAQFEPIGVEFSLPEGDLAAILAARAAAPVAVSLQTPDGQRVEGHLAFINNTVTTGSGTINLKASFPNPRQTLWPGAFVKATLSAGLSKASMVLPPQAILEGPAGKFVYVVDAANKVSARPVTVLRIQDRQAVVEGLEGGVRVVLDGNQNVSPGAVVQIAPTVAVAGQ